MVDGLNLTIKKTDGQIFKNTAICYLQEIYPKHKDPGKNGQLREEDIEPKDSCIVIVIFST